MSEESNTQSSDSHSEVEGTSSEKADYESTENSADSSSEEEIDSDTTRVYASEVKPYAKEKIYVKGSKLYEMALEKNRNEPVTDEEISELEEILEKEVREGKQPASPLATNPRHAKKLNYLNEVLNEFYENPSKYTHLKSFLRTIGYSIRDPKTVAVSDDNPNMVAATDGESVFIINYDFENVLASFANRYNIDEHYALEMILTHEMVHLAQPKKVLQGKPFPYVAELDVESLLSHYFTQKAFKTGDFNYIKLAEVANTRYLENMINSYTDRDAA
ncbi:MAG: hypothetical protein ACMXYE_02400 [Candidatus Woesearchaeota archaeon]